MTAPHPSESHSGSASLSASEMLRLAKTSTEIGLSYGSTLGRMVMPLGLVEPDDLVQDAILQALEDSAQTGVGVSHGSLLSAARYMRRQSVTQLKKRSNNDASCYFIR